MKSMLLSLLTIVWTSLAAQITVTSSALPNVGDSIRMALDTNGVVDLQGIGGPKTWSWLDLQNHRSTSRVYLAASTGANFASYPGADLMVVGQNGSETYYDRTNTQLSVLGYAGPDPANLGVAVLARFEPPFVVQRAPINFFDINQSTTNLVVALSLADIPDSLFMLPIPGIDSIRIRFTTQRLDVVDAYGSMSIPGQTEQVLREKRTEYASTGLDIHSFLGWTAIPAGGGGGGGIPAGFLGNDTTISYRFYANNVKEELASVQLGADQLTPDRVSFKNNMVSAVGDISTDLVMGSIHAFPNPAVDEVNFECRNLQPGTYSLKIFNLLGKTVWSQQYQIAGTKSIKVDLEQMRKGTYLYSLSDAQGNVVGTKRLVVIKP